MKFNLFIQEQYSKMLLLIKDFMSYNKVLKFYSSESHVFFAEIFFFMFYIPLCYCEKIICHITSYGMYIIQYIIYMLCIYIKNPEFSFYLLVLQDRHS